MISMILMLLRMLKGVGHDGDLVLTNTWGAESRKWRLLNPEKKFIISKQENNLYLYDSHTRLGKTWVFHQNPAQWVKLV